MIEKYFSQFTKWLISIEFSNSEVAELILILPIILLSSAVVLNGRKLISSFYRHKLEGFSQRVFDIKYTTTFVLGLIAALFISIQFLFPLFESKVSFLSDMGVIVLLWLGTRALTHIFDQSLLSRFVSIVLWITSSLFIIEQLDPLMQTLKEYSYKAGKIEFSLHTFVIGIVIFSILFWITALIASLSSKYVKSNPKLNIAQKTLVMKIVRIVLYSLVFIIGFQIIGLDLTTIAVFGGAIGFGIGFGLQKIFSNLISGIILLLDKSVRPGDIIAVAGTYGEVKKLDARYVSVVTRDGKKHLIPNESLISERVENWSFMDNKIRLHIEVGVAYDSDLDKVREIMLEAAGKASTRILKYPEPVCLLMNFGDSAVEFELRVWISDPQNGCERPQSEVMFYLWNRFKEENISIPFPQREVKILNDKKGMFA